MTGEVPTTMVFMTSRGLKGSMAFGGMISMVNKSSGQVEGVITVSQRRSTIPSWSQEAVVLSTDGSRSADGALLRRLVYFHSVFEGIAIGVRKTTVDRWRALCTVSFKVYRLDLCHLHGTRLRCLLDSITPILTSSLFVSRWSWLSPLITAIPKP
ncbi:hypothetical protein NE237_030218 [Protea cynaroides]|uniref:Uncharacterized protein n=1 Tax=Protea cynaroides TaxID=273540 RepID=A0A9Q0JVJ8_9MAGN|nr:hypothetical protein NE237_030218 [Protea cynaroides]